MIAKLTGRLDSVAEGSAVVDVSGVGYLVLCSGRTLAGLGAPGEAVSLVIETHVREDHINLYGFGEDQERDWFRALMSVQGVGAKVALAILSVSEAAMLAGAIAAQDHVPLTVANGVGPKLAKRIVLELKDKAPTLALGSTPTAMASTSQLDDSGPARDAVSALVNLGYQRTDAFTAVSAAATHLAENAAVEDLIKGGLVELGR
ncbi:MAG: Holliday junction branch migration protein RuvA [Alphaproteobacteria bacterium]|jgi:holliday junction DNA helicase RuvA|nr:Holliday junction branch migration protein RuvA [Alphaproteobacteria bacterium]MBT4711616.1 Holliday junction branch migration protein RuvA [Alphaproteobacteria bacterium]MBT5860942.1 Holliday junction branch migration protein RuvA [Alphaproteobacteria bacterium]